MGTSPEDLIKLFSDGSMPTGANFASLIKSMTSRADFDARNNQVDDWMKRGTVHFGDDGKGWIIERDSSGQLQAKPVDEKEMPPQTATFNVHGWVGMFGRLGTWTDGKTSSDQNDKSKVPFSVVADGNWKPLISMPAGLSAFEIVAATQPFMLSVPDPAIPSRLSMSQSGPRGPQIIHAFATATGPRAKPMLEITPAQRLKPLLWSAVSLLAIAAVFLIFKVTEGLYESMSQLVQAMLSWALSKISVLEGVQAAYANWTFGGVFLVAGALLLVAWFRRQRETLRLRVRKVSGSAKNGDRKWVLEICAPKNQEQPLIHYRIIALWS